MAKINRLDVLDKCANGELPKYRELTIGMFDDMSILYDAIHPFIDNLAIEAVSYVRATDCTQFILHTTASSIKPTGTTTGGVRVDVDGTNTIVNIPVKSSK